MPNGLFYIKSLDISNSYIRSVWLVFLISMLCRNSELNANSVDPDQTPRSAASDLGLCCLQISLLWDATLKGFKGVKKNTKQMNVKTERKQKR